MLPSRHIALSFPLGLATGLFTQSAIFGFLCFFSGVLIDIDHLIDYLANRGLETLNVVKIYRSCGKMAYPETEGGTKKIFLIFHAIEIAILLWVGYALSKNLYFLSIAIGYTGHLAADAIFNANIRPQSYFILWRIINRFKTAKLIIS